MEDKEAGKSPPESDANEQEDSSRKDEAYYSILTSIPPQDCDTLKSPLPTPQAQSHYTHMPSYSQPPDFVQPIATYPQTDPRGFGASAISSSTPPLGHPPYSAAAPGAETFSPLPPLVDSSEAGMPPMQTYPGYESYQSSAFGYGSTGQSYSYGANTSMPYSSLGAAASQTGYAGSQTGYAASQTGYAASQVLAGSSYLGIGAGSTYGDGAQAYPYYESGYPHQPWYQGQTGYGPNGAPSRGQGYYQGPLPTNRGRGRGSTGRSYARNPGKPFFKDSKRSGPDGANLFVFHIPNDMSNAEMFSLFKPYGNVLSVRIMTEDDTGRGRGYGFVSYDNVKSAARAIHFLNGYQIHGKRLKVQHKQVRSGTGDQERHRNLSPPGFMAMQQYAMPSHPHQHEVLPDQSSAGFVPLQEYAGQPQPDQASSPVLPSFSQLMSKESDSGHYQGALRSTKPPEQEYAGQSQPDRASSPVLPSFSQLMLKESDPGDYQGALRSTAQYAGQSQPGRASSPTVLPSFSQLMLKESDSGDYQGGLRSTESSSPHSPPSDVSKTSTLRHDS
ncbi:hypothetical protein ACHAXR_009535 [Thalassiosira sp. AJA248-18]